MEILLFFVLIYAAKRGWDDAWEAWRKSRSAYTTRADRNHPHMPAGKRAGHALRHDLGHAASQVRHGFPQGRHGFAEGWHRGRAAHDQARAGRERAKADRLETRARLLPDLRDYRRRQKEALEEIRRQEQGEGSEGSGGSGSPELPSAPEPEDERPTRRPDGKPETDADKRFFDARDTGYKGPIDQDGVPVPDPSDPDPDRNQYPPGQDEDTPENPPGQQQEDTQPDTPETPHRRPGEEDGNMSETTYQSVKSMMDTAETEAEQYAAEAEQSETVTEEHVEQAKQAKDRGTNAAEEMQSLEVDAETLSAMADHLEALDNAEKRAAELNDLMTQLKEAWQRVQETAEQVKSQLDSSGHGALDEAHSNAANGGAQKDFYGEGG